MCKLGKELTANKYCIDEFNQERPVNGKVLMTQDASWAKYGETKDPKRGNFNLLL